MGSTCSITTTVPLPTDDGDSSLSNHARNVLVRGAARPSDSSDRRPHVVHVVTSSTNQHHPRTRNRSGGNSNSSVNPDPLLSDCEDAFGEDELLRPSSFSPMDPFSPASLSHGEQPLSMFQPPVGTLHDGSTLSNSLSYDTSLTNATPKRNHNRTHLQDDDDDDDVAGAVQTSRKIPQRAAKVSPSRGGARTGMETQHRASISDTSSGRDASNEGADSATSILPSIQSNNSRNVRKGSEPLTMMSFVAGGADASTPGGTSHRSPSLSGFNRSARRSLPSLVRDHDDVSISVDATDADSLCVAATSVAGGGASTIISPRDLSQMPSALTSALDVPRAVDRQPSAPSSHQGSFCRRGSATSATISLVVSERGSYSLRSGGKVKMNGSTFSTSIGDCVRNPMSPPQPAKTDAITAENIATFLAQKDAAERRLINEVSRQVNCLVVCRTALVDDAPPEATMDVAFGPMLSLQTVSSGGD